MKIVARIKPNARKREVVKVKEGEYVVSVVSPAREGKANEELIEALSEHFKVAKSRVRIIGGLKSKKKVLEIL